MESKSQAQQLSAVDLLELISWKEEYPDEAKDAFHKFCFQFESFIMEKAEIFCDRWNYNEVVALEISKCVLARVWKYPTFKPENYPNKSILVGVKLWLGRIVFTQLANYHNDGHCYEPDEDSDLSIVYTFDELAEISVDSDEDISFLREKLSIIEEAISTLSIKHQIIYLTYKAYEQDGRYVSRGLLKRMREELDLTQPSIRKYKEVANNTVKEFLSNRNG